MSNYTIVSPSIDAILSDDALYFEGIKRPLIAYAVRESMTSSLESREHIVILEKYFNDIYSLFLKKLAVFSGEDSVSGESATKLQALLQEMIKVKGLIEVANGVEDRGR
jgi:hypothetical protein